jgi:SWI/SNF-related matrix-associated actin-dependent regulator of chromatin subfamily A3
MTVVPVTLSREARELYDQVELLSQQRFQNFVDEQGRISGAQAQSNVLSMLTRLRQLVLHPALIPRDYVEILCYAAQHGKDELTSVINTTAQDRVRLQSVLAQMIEDNEECPICMGILQDPRITGCGHSFCLAW